MPDLPFDDLLTRLRTRLTEPLPGQAAQLVMAPAYRRNQTLADVRDKTCREAGVLALLYPDNGVPTLVLTARRAHLKQHAGQISFPGGRREAGEALLDTALREAHEEVALPPADVEILGTLTPLFIPPSNYCVYPFVGAVPYAPAFKPEATEVDAIVPVPLAHLLAPTTRRREAWTLHGRTVNVPFFAVDDHTVWGATAMMLAELLAVIDPAQPVLSPEELGD